MQEWLRIAFSPPVVHRALKYALFAGLLLIAINHGDAILSMDVSLGRLAKMVLTVIVPYMVSTSSSVSAIQELTPR